MIVPQPTSFQASDVTSTPRKTEGVTKKDLLQTEQREKLVDRAVISQNCQENAVHN